MKSQYKILLGVVIGGILGFAYYHFIGCTSGACPITSNPYISVAYGGIIGLVLAMGKGNKKVSKDS